MLHLQFLCGKLFENHSQSKRRRLGLRNMFRSVSLSILDLQKIARKSRLVNKQDILFSLLCFFSAFFCILFYFVISFFALIRIVDNWENNHPEIQPFAYKLNSFLFAFLVLFFSIAGMPGGESMQMSNQRRMIAKEMYRNANKWIRCSDPLK